jgi:hypothetical protein
LIYFIEGKENMRKVLPDPEKLKKKTMAKEPSDLDQKVPEGLSFNPNPDHGQKVSIPDQPIGHQISNIVPKSDNPASTKGFDYFKGFPCATRAWRAVRMLHQQGKPFKTRDLIIICNEISSDYAKKYISYLVLCGVLQRTAPSKSPHSSYILIKDEPPEIPFIHPSYYRLLLATTRNLEEKIKLLLATTRNLEEKIKEIQKEAQSVDKKADQAITPHPESADQAAPPKSSSDQDKSQETTMESIQASTKDSTEDSRAKQEEIIRQILGGFHDDLSNKIQVLNLYCHKIWKDKNFENIQEGFLLLDLIRHTLRLYYLKVAQAARDGLIPDEKVFPMSKQTFEALTPFKGGNYEH